MANMIVSGAGSTEVNGTYVESGTNKGRPKYVYDNYVLIWSSGWGIVTQDFSAAYYYSEDDVATPDLCTTWEVIGDGELPVPTVTEEVTGIPKHFLYYARMRGN
jgi:hypothetical protein